MARKSRKETAAVAVQEADAACRAAIYVRLSVEDTHTHSVSIETQQMIIARYLEQYPEISVYDTYIDNGATGTNFHRPGFQQMLSDIEAGHVNCVIVKDDCVIKALTPQTLENRHFSGIGTEFRAIWRPQRAAHIIGTS